MANPNAPFGFRPIRYIDGRPFGAGTNEYQIPDVYATAIGNGDPVKTVAASSLSTDPGLQIGKGVSNAYVRGVFVGARWNLTDGSVFFRPTGRQPRRRSMPRVVAPWWSTPRTWSTCCSPTPAVLPTPT